MRKLKIQFLNLILLTVFTLFVWGCQEGSNNQDPINSLGGDLTGSGGDSTGVNLAQVHQPEPSTMLLIGSGVMALRYFRKRKIEHNS